MECLEFFSGTFYHSRRTTDIKLLVWKDIFFRNPVSDVPLELERTIRYSEWRREWWFTRKILDMLKIWEVLSDFRNFRCIKAIYKAPYPENKCNFFWFLDCLARSKKLTVEWSKSCPCTDKTLWKRCFFENKMSERYHPCRNTLNLSITNEWTPLPIWNTLDNEGESIFCEWCQWIRAIESWSKLKKDILSCFWNLTNKIIAPIRELKDIMSQLFFLDEMQDSKII